MSEATTLATMAKEWRVGLIYGLLAAFAVAVPSYFIGKSNGTEVGYVRGLTELHQMCYNNLQAFIELDGRAIICGRVGNPT